jgi:mono/diheme cytochrome c family protein
MKLMILPALSILLAGGCGGGPRPADTEPLMEVFRKHAQSEGLTRRQTDGKAVFGHYCVTCHGDNGQGDGQNAYNLAPPPPDFRTSLKGHPESYWRQIIEGGSSAVGRSPLCPPFGRTLAAKQVDALLDYLGALAKPAAPPAK